jgi:hypothetical protein
MKQRKLNSSIKFLQTITNINSLTIVLAIIGLVIILTLGIIGYNNLPKKSGILACGSCADGDTFIFNAADDCYNCVTIPAISNWTLQSVGGGAQILASGMDVKTLYTSNPLQLMSSPVDLTLSINLTSLGSGAQVVGNSPGSFKSFGNSSTCRVIQTSGEISYDCPQKTFINGSNSYVNQNATTVQVNFIQPPVTIYGIENTAGHPVTDEYSLIFDGTGPQFVLNVLQQGDSIGLSDVGGAIQIRGDTIIQQIYDVAISSNIASLFFASGSLKSKVPFGILSYEAQINYEIQLTDGSTQSLIAWNNPVSVSGSSWHVSSGSTGCVIKPTSAEKFITNGPAFVYFDDGLLYTQLPPNTSGGETFYCYTNIFYSLQI